jgi:translation elongation factor EF-4
LNICTIRDLEQERGITIKAQTAKHLGFHGQPYTLFVSELKLPGRTKQTRRVMDRKRLC